MASRRKLKKTIQFISSELINEIYFRCLLSDKVDFDLVEKMSVDILKICSEFIQRAGHPDGKENPRLVKVYYKKLFADWEVEMEKVVKDMEKI